MKHFIEIYLYIIFGFNLCNSSRNYGDKSQFQGRFTKDINEFELVVPRRVDAIGEFVSYTIPQYYKHDFQEHRRKRDLKHPGIVHYGIIFNDRNHHVQLWPNHGLISPGAVVERHGENAEQTLADRHLNMLKPKQCYYTGAVRDHDGSRAALSLCDGLAGYLRTNQGTYFIEPVEEHDANHLGQHLHIVHKINPEKLNNKKDRTLFLKTTTEGVNKKYHEDDEDEEDDYEDKVNNDEVEKARKRLRNQCRVDKWDTGWADRFRRDYRERGKYEDPNLESSKTVAKKRGLESVHRYLETLVVADKRFIEFHTDHDHETYILTIMNMVSDFYHDSSSGNQMDVVVVRLIYLDREKKTIDLLINPNAEDTLESFCKWQMDVNPKDIEHPHHHDIAVLLTRYDICSDNLTNCDLLGLAFVAAACTNDRPCCINEDSGLVLGVVVAHEMGHVMGCNHDEVDISGCEPQAADKSYHVMSPYVHLGTGRWSTCSQAYITTFFENNLGECLNDEPQETKFKGPGMPAGAMYDAKYQCNMAFPGSTTCGVDPTKFCEKLFCRDNPKSCKSLGEPAADGTKCGENKWCYGRQCVEIGERPGAVAGGWGQWGGWSECSRTCGGGISVQERLCNNPVPKNKGRYCLGERKRAKICNIEPCENRTVTFLAMQCSEFNSKPFKNNLHTWEPYVPSNKPDPCALYCINEKRVFAKLAPRAKDGTRCKPGTKHMCVAGVCMKVGCDWVLNSNAVEDICGICNGDGTECTRIERTYDEQPGRGYKKIFTIPKGSRNIMVVEVIASGNTLAVSAVDEKTFFLNGDNKENADGEKDFGGVKGVYEHPEPDREEVVIGGPTTQDLVFYIVYYSSKNALSAVRYAYSVPKAQDSNKAGGSPQSTTQRVAETSITDTGPTPPPVYHWEFLEWAPCSVRCGGGNSIAKPSCVEERTGKVTDDMCKELPEKPEVKTRMCNADECRAKWKVGPWGPCSGCTFRSGVRKRNVQCVREAQHDGEDDIISESKACAPLGPKPGTRELCSTRKKCTEIQEESNPLEPDLMKREAKSPFDNLWKHLIYAPIQSRNGNLREEVNYETGGDEKNEEKRNNANFLKPHGHHKHKKVDKDMNGHFDDKSKQRHIENHNKYHSYRKQHPSKDDYANLNEEINSESTTVTSTMLTEPSVGSSGEGTTNTHHKYMQSENCSSDTEVTEKSSVKPKETPEKIFPQQHPSAELKNTTIVEEGRNDVITTPYECGGEDSVTSTVVPKAEKMKINDFFNGTKSIKDAVPPEEIKLIVVPLKIKTANKISDELFEKIGDKLGDQIDMSKKQVFCGKEAAQRLQSNLTSTSGTSSTTSSLTTEE